MPINNFKKYSSDIKLYDCLLLLFIVSIISYRSIGYITFPLRFIFIFLSTIRFLKKNYNLTLYAGWSLGFIILCFISSVYAKDEYLAFFQSVIVVQTLLFSNFLIPYMLESDKKLNFVMDCLIIGAIILIIRLLITVPFSAWGTIRLGDSIDYNANVIGLTLSFVSVIAFYRFLNNKRLIYFIIFLLLGLTSLFSGSKKAVLVIALGIVLISFVSTTNFRELLSSFFFVFILSIILYQLVMKWEPLYYIIGIRIEKLVAGLLGNETDYSTKTRLSMIKVGWEYFKEKPIFGYGVDNYRIISGQYTYSHNNYMEVLVSLGMVGIIYYYSIYFYILMKSISLIKINNRKFIVLSITIVCVLLFTETAIVSYYNEFYHILLVIAFVSLKKQESKITKSGIINVF